MYQHNKTIQKTIKNDDVTKKNIIKHNLNCSQIPDHPYRILIIGASRSGKTNALRNLIKPYDDDHHDDY